MDAGFNSNTEGTGAGPGFDFSKALQHASKIKSAQLAKIRKHYESSPDFIKATSVYASRNNHWRDLSITEKLDMCEACKTDGNTLFRNKDYSKALNQYAQSMSLFRHFEAQDEKGEYLKLKDYIAEGYNQDAECIAFWAEVGNFERAKTLIMSLLLNCATVSLQLRKHGDVIWCCQTVLKYDDNNAKAWYKMCQSHEILDTTYDLEFALKYITKAKSMQPKNQEIRQKYKSIKSVLREQNKKDKKQFTGLFSKAALYTDKETLTEREIEVKNNCCDRLVSYCKSFFIKS